jgi:hypothetical protein
MSILGVGQGPITPVPSDRQGSGNQQNRSAGTTQGVTGNPSQLAAQQFGSRPGAAPQPGGVNAFRTGGQPLNRTGRGQILNIIV